MWHTALKEAGLAPEISPPLATYIAWGLSLDGRNPNHPTSHLPPYSLGYCLDFFLQNTHARTDAEHRRDRVFEIVVLGVGFDKGVVGLTTALEIQQRGKGKYRVTVVADAFPGGPNTGVKYTNFEKDTLKTFWELSEPGAKTEECFLRIIQTEYFYKENSPGPEQFEQMSSYKLISPKQLPLGALSGCSFQTITIDPPIYLNWLFTRFVGLGGRTVRGHVQHLSQIIEGGINIFGDRYASAVAKYGIHNLGLSGYLGTVAEGTAGIATSNTNTGADAIAATTQKKPESEDLAQKLHIRRRKGEVNAVIVCTGMGARFSGGVEDLGMYLIRGQTVIVNAPWVRSGWAEVGKKDEEGNLVLTYIIPRRTSDVVVGGTREDDDWYPHPREETALAILSRAIKLCPQLASPEVRTLRPPAVEDVLPHVVGEGCGLRSGRKGGTRIECEWWTHKGKLEESARSGKNSAGSENFILESRTLVVYNYGHAGYGYQSSWGCARKAATLLETGLRDL